MHYDFIENYTMKCRLYVSEEQKARIVKALTGVRVYYNCTLHAILNEGKCTQEKTKKRKGEVMEGETVHFPDLRKAQSAGWKKQITSEHPVVENAPAGALVGNNGCIGADMARALGKDTVEYIHYKFALRKIIQESKTLSPEEKKRKLKEITVPHFYSARHPRASYTYQEACSKIEQAENPKVLFITLNKIGRCKIRGWNQSLRFDKEGTVDFPAFCQIDKKKRLTVTVSLDNCGDCWICFKLADVYKPMKSCAGEAVGVDVGIKDIAILSDGEKYKNKRFKAAEKRRLRLLDRKISRRQGWANEKFREEHRKNKELTPSKGYEEARLRSAKLERRIQRRRNNWNNVITREIVERHGAIAVESLNVKGMFRNRHLAYALSDAAMGDILGKLKYKAEWHGREIREIGRWTPSSKRCSSCGAIKERLKLSEREWTCPRCGKHHDRDINAAINILLYAYDLNVAA